MRVMYDSTTAADIPTTATMVAGYIDGDFIWSNSDWNRWGDIPKIQITIHPDHNTGDVYDYEPGNPGYGNPNNCPNYIRMRMNAGHPRPTIYCSRYDIESVQQACRAAPSGLIWALWAADWTGTPHTIPGASAVQYANPATGSGGHWDLSEVYDDLWHPTHVYVQPPAPPFSMWQWWRQHHGNW